jgi:hypothetical protein
MASSLLKLSLIPLVVGAWSLYHLLTTEDYYPREHRYREARRDALIGHEVSLEEFLAAEEEHGPYYYLADPKNVRARPL